MPTAQKTKRTPQRSSRKGRKAPVVRQRTSRSSTLPTDAESIQLRREGAAREKARVTCRESGKNVYYGLFEVESSQWKEPYRVEIRSLTEPLNTCSCQDHRMNRLGTCKHIERVLQGLLRRGKRRFAAAAVQGPDTYEIFFDTRESPPRLRCMRPARRLASLDSRLNDWFDSDGAAVDTAMRVWTALESARSKMSAPAKARLRLSREAPYWLSREREAAMLRTLRGRFDADLAAGRRSDDPLRHPLYPYQKQGMLHLAFSGRALLADDMGLGKTVQAIAAAELLRQYGKVRRVLVVSPASLKAEWEEQIEHFTGLQASLVFGHRSARLRLYAEDRFWTLCNYEQVRNDVDEINRLMVPDLVILDEAQRIKNWPTRTAKTIKRLRSPYAFVLTGTPLENRIEELYSLVEFVDPHLFGSLFRFQREYMEKIEDGSLRPRNLEGLHRRVSQVMLRRRKHDVEDDLPPRTDKNFFVPMTKEQRLRYGEYETEAAKLAAILKRRPLTRQEFERLQLLLACMRMICDTPYILDRDCRDCPKLDELENILDEVLADETAKVIVFSEWVRMLDLVKELLVEKGIGFAEHTGSIPQPRRRVEIRRFKQNPACRLFLSSESGGTGLNLQAANTVINLDLPWNPARLEQRIARAWRKHQPRGVQVINLVTESSIESNMIGKLDYKRALSDAVLDGKAFEPSLRTEGGRQAFAERVGALIGGEPLPAPTPEAMAPQAVPPAQRLEEIVTEHADGILAVEHQPATGAYLVIARPGANLPALRAAAASALGSSAQVLTPEMAAMLQQLQALGIVSLAPGLSALHAEKGYTPMGGDPPAATTLNRMAARRVWEEGEAERKAAAALDDIGLHAQARPHRVAALHNAHATLMALYDAKDATLPDRADDAHRRLARELAAAWNTPDETPETLARAQALLEDVTRLATA